MRASRVRGLLVVGGLLAACHEPGSGPATIAEVEVVRSPVQLGGRALAGSERVGVGGVVSAEAGARAWLDHDGSARALLDGGAKLTVLDDGFSIEAGRAWVEAAPGARAVVTTPAATLEVAGARLEAARAGDGLRIYVASGEVAYRLSNGARGVVHAGQLGELSPAAAKVTPAELWDDWTGGLAWPDPEGAAAGDGRSRGHGEVGARPPGSLGEARFPLAITRLEVRTKIEDDLATTRVVETFFNPASDTLEGLYRLRVPEGAILQRFAIDRNGRWADGFVKERETARAEYQAQVYQGSTKDPALLEWDAPGSYRARLYPIQPGASRKVLVEYTEWLTPHAGGRTFRYPLAAGGGEEGAPLIQELDVEVDGGGSGARSLRAGLDARIADLAATLTRTDYRPRADLVIDLVDGTDRAATARAYRSPHRLLQRALAKLAREDDYYMARVVPLPLEAAGERPPLDLVILTDVSAATDATHLQLARTTVEALLRHLGEHDRVAVAGADLELRRPGAPSEPPKLIPATRVQLDPLLDALARQGTGGATDLGATLAQAAGLLASGGPEAERHGAVIYIGDALPTVGELDAKALNERLDRLPAPLRLYGIGIGDDADLTLLSSLSAGGGLALRVGDRSQAATAALRILGHASRRVLQRVQADVGSGLDRGYPRRAVTVVEGEPFELLARVRGELPKQLALVGLLEGKPWKASFALADKRLDGDDLRLRWASQRLAQLLADGASGEEVAELGTRQNLITPFTSYYVPSADELSLLEQPTPAEVALGVGLSAFGCSAMERGGGMAKSAPVAADEPAPPPPPSSTPTGAPTVVAPKQARRGGSDGEEAAAAQPGMATESARSAAPAPLEMMGGPPSPKAEAPAPIAAAVPASPMAHMAAPMKRSLRRAAPLDSSSGGGGLDDLVQEKDEAKGIGYLGGGLGGMRANAPATSQVAYDKRSDDGDELLLLRIDVYAHHPRHCSAASRLPLADRADLWRERLSQHTGVDGVLEVWQDASSGCELSRWADRRALLSAMLGYVGGPAQMVALYRRMGDDGAATDFLRRAMLAAARTPESLRIIADGLGLSDEVQWTLADALLAKAKTPEERLHVLEQLEKRWPGDVRLSLRMMDALEALGRKEEARRVAEAVRQSPGVDAAARTAVGELLSRLGDEAAARRAFSEIVEFAPRDPVARRRLGDLYRAHGWWSEALRQYETLAELVPGDAAVLLLQAAAAAGAGRVDEALRLEQRVASATEPGSETGVARVAMWWSTLRLALLRDDARGKHDDAELARLFGRTRRANVLHDPRPLQIFLTWAHPEADCELYVALPGEPMQPAADVAPEFGIASIASHEPAAGPTTIEIRRPPGAAASELRYAAELLVMRDEGQKDERIMRVPIAIAPGREVLRFRVDGDKVEVLQ